MASVITRTKDYMERMSFARGHQELLIERDSVAARIEPDSLAASPALWSSIEDSFSHLQARYANAYAAHHAAYHQQAVDLVSHLEEARPHIDAIARFNEFPEFGGPFGADLPRRLEALLSSLASCDASEEGVSLEAAPVCERCLLPLSADIPHREVGLVLNDTARAMREYNRRLSSHGARRILAHPSKEPLDKFVALVQVADPSALANVLDDDVVDFLRQFLRSG
jgi:hypothetical protein